MITANGTAKDASHTRLNSVGGPAPAGTTLQVPAVPSEHDLTGRGHHDTSTRVEVVYLVYTSDIRGPAPIDGSQQVPTMPGHDLPGRNTHDASSRVKTVHLAYMNGVGNIRPGDRTRQVPVTPEHDLPGRNTSYASPYPPITALANGTARDAASRVEAIYAMHSDGIEAHAPVHRTQRVPIAPEYDLPGRDA